MKSLPIAIACVAALSACAHAPEGPPIVLRKPPPAPHIVKRPEPGIPIPPVPGEEPAPLAPPDKEALFRAFDAYLNQVKPPK